MRKWNKNEEKFMKHFYKNTETTMLKDALNRSKISVVRKACAMGLKKNPNRDYVCDYKLRYNGGHRVNVENQKFV